MNKAALFLLLFLPALARGQTPTVTIPTLGGNHSGSVTVQLSWKYFAIPAEMKTFEMKAGLKEKLWDTDVVKNEKDLPVGAPLKNDTFVVRPGQNKRFVLVYKNTTDKPLNFFAAPHEMKPEANSLGFKFKCLCINKTYEVPPGAYWYRVVELRVSSEVSVNHLEITHSLFAVKVEKNSDLQYKPDAPMDMDQGM